MTINFNEYIKSVKKAVMILDYIQGFILWDCIDYYNRLFFIGYQESIINNLGTFKITQILIYLNIDRIWEKISIKKSLILWDMEMN